MYLIASLASVLGPGSWDLEQNYYTWIIYIIDAFCLYIFVNYTTCLKQLP